MAYVTWNIRGYHAIVIRRFGQKRRTEKELEEKKLIVIISNKIADVEEKWTDTKILTRSQEKMTRHEMWNAWCSTETGMNTNRLNRLGMMYKVTAAVIEGNRGVPLPRPAFIKSASVHRTNISTPFNMSQFTIQVKSLSITVLGRLYKLKENDLIV